MIQRSTAILLLIILAFHLIVAGTAAYGFISDFSGWTLHLAYPLLLLVYTSLWVGIFFKKRWCVFAYFSVMFYELAMKLFFGQNLFGKVLGDVLFPANLIFSFVILVLYRAHFGDRTVREDKS
ncbi:MAG: hypothetical protein JNJ58_06290 [Chitinophagaceae bacterium]|nr:hypothetical protein [Chitinophagaceae bacterium]